MRKSLVKRIKWKKVLVLLACFYMLGCIVGGCFDIYKLKMQERELAQKIEAANEEHLLWEEKVEEMSSEEAMERIARERLGLVLPGEISLKKAE